MEKADTVRHGSHEARILFLDTTEFFGPVMQVHSRLIKHLDPNTYRILVAINCRADPGEHLDPMSGVIVKKYDFGVAFGREGGVQEKIHQVLVNLPALFNFLRILWLIRRERIDLIHTASTHRTILFGTMLSLLSGAKQVVHVHQEPKSRRRLRHFATFALRRARAIITVSHFIKQRVVDLGIEPAKVWPIWNIIDLEKFHPTNDGREIRLEFGIRPQTPVIATVGRVTTEKGQIDLLKALVAVKEVIPDVTALLVGWDARTRMPSGRTYQQELEEFCIQHELADNVIFTGPRADVHKVLAAVDAVVVPSRFEEPFGLVVLEGMATGKAVVGTIAGGIPEQLSDGTGVLVPKGNPEGLAEAIIRLLQQPQLREELGRAARKRAEEQFYERRLAQEAERVYASILNKRWNRS